MLSCELPWLVGLLFIDSEGDALISLYLQQICPQVCGVLVFQPGGSCKVLPHFLASGTVILLWCHIVFGVFMLYVRVVI